ncbi:MAG: hypothetical protein GC165_07505 [Armatimonadetes bacterium]|nr:hypothetical protein [Armatimonadota bacterium]
MNWKILGVGALGGALTAARVDYSSFKTWKSFKDAYAYDWGLASWRWFQGAVIGAVTAGGLTQLL